MAAQQIVAGWASAVKFDFETSFGTGGTPVYPFGYGVKVTRRINNNLERVYGVGSRNSQYTVAKKFEGNLTLEFPMNHPYWLRAVLGTQGAAGGGGPYTHAFSEANAPPSIVLMMGTALGTNNYVTTYTGVVVKSCKLALSQGETIKVTLECLYATESTVFTASFAEPADPTSTEVLSFQHGSITYAGQAMGLVYSGVVHQAELTIENNTEFIWGIGSRLAQYTVAKTREYNLRMTYAISSVANSADVFENTMGDTSTPILPAAGNITGVNLVLTITNNAATTLLRSLVITFTAAETYMNTSNMIFDVGEVLKDDVEGWSSSISTCVWTDNLNSGIGA